MEKGKSKKSIWKRWWFWLFAVLVIVIIGGFFIWRSQVRFDACIEKCMSRYYGNKEDACYAECGEKYGRPDY